jgi:hypothetical protein
MVIPPWSDVLHFALEVAFVEDLRATRMPVSKWWNTRPGAFGDAQIAARRPRSSWIRHDGAGQTAINASRPLFGAKVSASRRLA